MNNEQINKNVSNKILVLGSGLVCEPCVYYLLNRQENKITIASNNLEELNNIIINLNNLTNSNFHNLIELVYINITDDEKLLSDLVEKNDLIISLLPISLNSFVINTCLNFKKNLLTTSNLPDDWVISNIKVKEKGLTFIFEIGASPGLDHIIASKVIKQEEALNNSIIGYESWVGAVPSPECINNPILYTFSWDPKGALMTLTYDAKQLINGKVVTIPQRKLLTSYLVDKKFHPSLNLEGYYNQNSLKYKELYRMEKTKSFIRGIIRYQGFTFVIQCFKFLNLFSFDKIDEKTVIWRDHLNKILKNPRIQDNIYEIKDKYLKKGLEIFVYTADVSDSMVERIFYYNLCLLSLSHFDDKYIKKIGFEILFNRIYSALIYLELYKEDNKILTKVSAIDALAKLLEKKIIIKRATERDLLYFHNQFQIKLPNNRVFNKKYDLIVFGGHNNLPFTATSLLVGYPAAITAQMMLDKKIGEKGMILPMTSEIVDTVLSELKKINIYFQETIEFKAKF